MEIIERGHGGAVAAGFPGNDSDAKSDAKRRQSRRANVVAAADAVQRTGLSMAAEPRPDDAAAPRPPDFYVENGRVVFTAAHHLARGFCCGSGCRHCPYEPKHVEGNTKVTCPH